MCEKQGQEKVAYISFLPPNSSNQLLKSAVSYLVGPGENKTKDMCIYAVNIAPPRDTLEIVVTEGPGVA